MNYLYLTDELNLLVIIRYSLYQQHAYVHIMVEAYNNF
jgi:hypothetical protein